MREENIERMNFKELRKEVQLLRDELAMFVRRYNDTISNLDSDNFGSRFVKEQKGMAATIEFTANGLKTKVSQEDLAETLTGYSTIEQTAEAITTTVTAEYVNNLIGGGYVTNAVMMSQIQQSAEQIMLSVSTDYETKDTANDVYEQLRADITVNSEQIRLKVSEADVDTKLTNYSTIEHTANGLSTFVQRQADLKNAITITSLSQATDTTKTYKIQTHNANGNVISETYYYYNTLSNRWEKISGDTVYTMFNQTDEGFVLKGNTIIDGAVTITRNLVLSGNVTWDMENSPVKTQYSADSVSWHTTQTITDMYMRMSFDGGNTWSTPTKVVGTDGRDGVDGEDGRDGWDGSDGSDANVTPQNVFNALTDSGASQGIFAAFVKKQNQIYINAEYLSTKIAEVADVIYIGDYNTDDEQKYIYFNDGANIHTFESGYGQNGLAISSNGFQIHSKPADIKFIAPDGSSFSYGSISLEDYIAEYAGGSSGGGTAIAVFG